MESGLNLTEKCKYAEAHEIYVPHGYPSRSEYFCMSTKNLEKCPCQEGIKNEKCLYHMKEEDSMHKEFIRCKDCKNFRPFGPNGGQCDKYGILQISPDFYCASAEVIEKTRCSLCYSDNPEGSRFCNKCGKRL
jgi:hypothetical protein